MGYRTDRLIRDIRREGHQKDSIRVSNYWDALDRCRLFFIIFISNGGIKYKTFMGHWLTKNDEDSGQDSLPVRGRTGCQAVR